MNDMGSVVGQSLTNGVWLGQLTYSPYGDVMQYEGCYGSYCWYMGAYGATHDGGGVYHLNARHYHVKLKRFLTPDPIGLDGGFNLYLYVNANPVFYVDPLGLCPNSGSFSLNINPSLTDRFTQTDNMPSLGSRNVPSQDNYNPGSIEQRQTYAKYDRANTLTYGQVAPGPAAEVQGEITAAALQTAIFARFGPAPKPSGPRVFWSGGKEAKLAAKTFAKSSGGKTLEMTKTGKVLDLITTK